MVSTPLSIAALKAVPSMSTIAPSLVILLWAAPSSVVLSLVVPFRSADPLASTTFASDLQSDECLAHVHIQYWLSYLGFQSSPFQL